MTDGMENLRTSINHDVERLSTLEAEIVSKAAQAASLRALIKARQACLNALEDAELRDIFRRSRAELYPSVTVQNLPIGAMRIVDMEKDADGFESRPN